MCDHPLIFLNKCQINSEGESNLEDVLNKFRKEKN